ncbi:MAG: hypothetical protein K6U79_08870 [Firmicutes bacterium]|nr:hypothetical protein [Bacillota bacterium]
MEPLESARAAALGGAAAALLLGLLPAAGDGGWGPLLVGSLGTGVAAALAAGSRPAPGRAGEAAMEAMLWGPLGFALGAAGAHLAAALPLAAAPRLSADPMTWMGGLMGAMWGGAAVLRWLPGLGRPRLLALVPLSGQGRGALPARSPRTGRIQRLRRR